MIVQITLFGLLSFSLGAVGAWLVSKFAVQFGLMDLPNQRSSHTNPTPKGGGIGIVAAFTVASIAGELSPFFYLPVIALSITSFLGDRVDLSPILRLLIQFAAAFIVIYAICDASSLIEPFFISHKSNWFILILSVMAIGIYVVGTANFYNFMDGINGLAALTGAVTFSLLATYVYTYDLNTKWLLLCVSIVGASLGFLPFNIPKARVFMGDVGSIMLGFVFAVTVLVLADSLKSFLLLNSFLFMFYADELATMAERIKQGERLTKPHRRHLYQVLANEAGMAHWKVTFIYAASQLFIGFAFWETYKMGFWWLAVAFLLVSLLFITTNRLIKNRYIL